MRVLITTDAVGGVWEYATTLARHLVDQFGVEVMLAVCGARPPAARLSGLRLGLGPNGGALEIAYLDLPLEWQGASAEIYAAGRQQVLQLALSWHAHILHANEHYLGEIGKSGLPVVVVSHSDLCSWEEAINGDLARPVDAAYVDRVRAGLQDASLVVAPSHSVATSICRHFGFGGVVRVIPNGVERREMAQEARTIDAAMVGRLWDPAKNLDCFQRAVSGLGRGQFVAIGPLHLEAAATHDSPDDTIQYTGAVPNEEVRGVLARTRILVSPARYDPFGLVVAEAALAGCSLLLSSLDSYRAIWEDTARYFDPHAPHALQALLVELLAAPARREELGAAAQARALERYTADRMARAYYSTYQRLALRHGLAV